MEATGSPIITDGEQGKPSFATYPLVGLDSLAPDGVVMASERDRPRIYGIVSDHRRPEQRVFVGVTDPIDPVVETAEVVRDRVLEAAGYLPAGHLGTTDDCGFAPFGDDTSTARETAFAKIKARVDGTRLAEKVLGI